MPPALRIGQLAKVTGFTTKTIRYYEQLGLLRAPQRTEAGYRLYDDAAIERLEFVKRAKRLGLSLEEIRDVLTLHDRRQPPCVHVLAILDHKLDLLDRLLRDLQAFRSELAHLRAESAQRLHELPTRRGHLRHHRAGHACSGRGGADVAGESAEDRKGPGPPASCGDLTLPSTGRCTLGQDAQTFVTTPAQE